MKRLLSCILVLTCPAVATAADLVSGPDHSFLWNQFNSFVVLDSFALATSDIGLALLKLDPTTGRFSLANYLLLGNQALEAKVLQDMATISTSAGVDYFVDLSRLPQLTLLGESDIGRTVYDAVRVGQDLYLACGFDGLRHYTFGPGNDLMFVDSNLTPIHCIQLESTGPYLIALDDYNGLYRYDLTASGLASIESSILVPRRPLSFTLRGDSVVVPIMNRPLVYHAAFGAGGRIDSSYLSIIPDRLFIIDTFIVAVDIGHDQFEAISTAHGGSLIVHFAPSLLLTLMGDTYYHQGSPYLALVSRTRGLMGFNLANLWFDTEPRLIYAQPGPVTLLGYHGRRLCIGRMGFPLELYEVNSQMLPVFSTALSSAPSMSSIADGGSLLFAHIGATGQVLSLRDQGSTFTTVSSMTASTNLPGGIKYYEYLPNDTASMLLLIGSNDVSVVSVSVSGLLRPAGLARITETVEDAIVVDSFLLISTVVRQLHAYRIFSNYHLVYWWSISTPGPFRHMVNVEKRHAPDGSWQPGIVLGFDGNQMYEIMLRSDGFPITFLLGSLPVDVVNSSATPDALFTIGLQGVGVLDIRRDVPVLKEFGGYGGSLVTFVDSVLATSDGTAVHLYSYRNGALAPIDDSVETRVADSYLRPNYPNPFNPRTTIDFYVPEPGHVDLVVFDLLGRKVTTLVATQLSVGLHTVEWNGTDRFGDMVASGVYFYRMTTARNSESRKMVLLK